MESAAVKMTRELQRNVKVRRKRLESGDDGRFVCFESAESGKGINNMTVEYRQNKSTENNMGVT